MDLLSIADQLSRDVGRLCFASPVTHVYNPLSYARAPYGMYVRRYGQKPKPIFLLGMNPGPWGMAQTGVPFGEVAMVSDWLGIHGAVETPPDEHPKRSVDGFACTRSEVSGRRLWGWARSRFGSPERFFSRFFVGNYCPLVFMEAGGRNITPNTLPAAQRKPLEKACDQALRQTVAYLSPQWVIGIGNFARDRAAAALAGLPVNVGKLTHPSPANPKANRGWAAVIEAEFRMMGIDPDL